jgi:hypothetical protein
MVDKKDEEENKFMMCDNPQTHTFIQIDRQIYFLQHSEIDKKKHILCAFGQLHTYAGCCHYHILEGFSKILQRQHFQLCVFD